jgi:carboxypeptidase PM20D1
MRKLFALIGVAVLALALAVAGKTWFASSKQIAVAPVKPVAVNAEAAAARLGAAVRFKTVSSTHDAEANGTEFVGLHEHSKARFPKVHEVLKREAVGKDGLLYTWTGSDPRAKPIAFLAHQDVVPVAPGTEGDWQQKPFSGAIGGGFIWGRGAWDNKGNLMSILEAVEMLAATGLQPRQTAYLFFAQDEEVGGVRGAQQVVKLFKERAFKLDLVVDEGLVITQGLVPGIEAPVASIGIAEKSYITVQLNAKAPPGHSSMPPSEAGQTAIGMIRLALVRLEDKQMPAAIRGVAEQMFTTLAPAMQGMNRVFLSNLWLFKPVVERQLQKAASTNAMMRTTTALTIVQAGNAENVLPGRAQATVNFRLLPGDSSEVSVEHSAQAIANPAITIAKQPGVSEASKVSSSDGTPYETIARTLRQLHPDVIVSPGMMLAATDSRFFGEVADNIYRFAPVRAGPADLARFHGTNERISVANYAELIQFYHQFLQNASALPTPA